MNPADDRLEQAQERVSALLLEGLNADGHWSGELSSSALSTAVAAIALGQMDAEARATSNGLQWLAANANTDGGWGDTVRSKSNISTTALCWAAFGAAGADARFAKTVERARNWLAGAAGSIEALPEAVAARYGKDRTFSVPILMTLALSGRLRKNGWSKVPALPFELAIVPRRFYGAIRLPVVSYALPALIAIGQAIHHHAPSANPLLRFFRNSCRARTLDLLSRLQPSNGGFLEATPLTAFVTMSLASAGNKSHSVAQKGAGFLRSSQRSDGSWPIDTNLATWVTTLSIKALARQPELLTGAQRVRLNSWLLGQQTNSIHPYTGAAAGAWAWTDLPGGVPDADDTAGALLALHELGFKDLNTTSAAERGVRWLIDLQNRDGGIPTFCPGWGTLPFDRSTPEITAHALRAWSVWRGRVSPGLGARIERANHRALSFLRRNQAADGSFVPLWFGNEHGEDDANPVYGTAQVLMVLNEIGREETVRSRAARYLANAQLSSGGWGGAAGAPETVEETAVALEALSGCGEYGEVVSRGAKRLLEMIEAEAWREPAPIGLYFARLWYYERLYPLIFATSALGALRAARNRRVSAGAATVS